eukprot:gene4919-biopygen11583
MQRRFAVVRLRLLQPQPGLLVRALHVRVAAAAGVAHLVAVARPGPYAIPDPSQYSSESKRKLGFSGFRRQFLEWSAGRFCGR